jgi:hypothetical protein
MRSHEISANSSLAERKQNCRPRASLPNLFEETFLVWTRFFLPSWAHKSDFLLYQILVLTQGPGYRRLQAAGVPGFPRIHRGNAGFGVSVEGVAPSSPWDLPASGLLSGEPRACALLCCPRSLHDLFGARYFSSGVGSGFGYISLVYLIFAPCVVSSWSPAIQGDV